MRAMDSEQVSREPLALQDDGGLRSNPAFPFAGWVVSGAYAALRTVWLALNDCSRSSGLGRSGASNRFAVCRAVSCAQSVVVR